MEHHSTNIIIFDAISSVVQLHQLNGIKQTDLLNIFSLTPTENLTDAVTDSKRIQKEDSPLNEKPSLILCDEENQRISDDVLLEATEPNDTDKGIEVDQNEGKTFIESTSKKKYKSNALFSNFRTVAIT